VRTPLELCELIFEIHLHSRETRRASIRARL